DAVALRDPAAESEGRSTPPSSRTLTAIEREHVSSIPPPQTRRALAMALAAVAVGVMAAVIGSVILRGPEVAAFGLVAGLDGARSALRAAATRPAPPEVDSTPTP